MTIEYKDLIVMWFEHIVQIANDRKTANGFIMKDSDALDEIKAKAKECAEYVKKIC